MADNDSGKPPKGKLNFLQTLKVVAWGFFGVRNKGYRSDTARVNPVHLIIAGILSAAIFVIVLVVIVRWVVSSAA
jgi:hypothetical protein